MTLIKSIWMHAWLNYYTSLTCSEGACSLGRRTPWLPAPGCCWVTPTWGPVVWLRTETSILIALDAVVLIVTADHSLAFRNLHSFVFLTQDFLGYLHRKALLPASHLLTTWASVIPCSSLVFNSLFLPSETMIWWYIDSSNGLLWSIYYVARTIFGSDNSTVKITMTNSLLWCSFHSHGGNKATDKE